MSDLIELARRHQARIEVTGTITFPDETHLKHFLAASAPVAVSQGAAGDGDIIRGMVALTHIGWAPDLRYDDDGRWKIQADSFCELPWHDSPREAWDFFVRERLKDEPEARAALESKAKPPAQE